MLDLEFLEVLQSFLSEEFLAQFGEGLLLKKKMGLLGIVLSSFIGLVYIHFAIQHFHNKLGAFSILIPFPLFLHTKNKASHLIAFYAGLSSP
jgi:hypothetical protein